MTSSLSPTSSPSPKSQPVSSRDEDNVSPLPTSQRLFAPEPSSNNGTNIPAINLRRPSIQFAPSAQVVVPNAGARRPSIPKNQRRISSPPPPPAFQKRVSFNTFESKDTPEFSLTLNEKHRDFHYSRRSRIYLCGLNNDEYSQNALEWLIDELVEDGDEIIVLRVVDPNSKYLSDRGLREERYAKDARDCLDWVISKNHEQKAISLVMEFAVGEVPELIQRMINTYEPAMLVVGTRGKSLSGIQGLLPGSVSKYCLQNSPVPVIVVQPHNKVQKKKNARQKKPEKGSYQEILEASGNHSSYVLDHIQEDNPLPQIHSASLQEAKAVADAIGVPPAIDYSLPDMAAARNPTARADANPEDGENPKSPGVVMKSPTLGDLETPPVSDSEESDREDMIPKPGSMLSTHDVASDDEDSKKDESKLATADAS
ncbi:MAG: hypothetical protein M1814_004433 [Vezdaea aestivalis]|nr:MAG: hypothetical protein M1814_004433 [Vezdaea aestivalis]